VAEQAANTNKVTDGLENSELAMTYGFYPLISLHVHIAVRPPNPGSKHRRYRGDRGGGGRTSLNRPPDKSSSRMGRTSLCTFWDGVRRQRRWSQARRQRECRTCLQNRCRGESSQAGSIPVRLRYQGKRLPTSGADRPSALPETDRGAQPVVAWGDDWGSRIGHRRVRVCVPFRLLCARPRRARPRARAFDSA
jgi:hypothetical protein